MKHSSQTWIIVPTFRERGKVAILTRCLCPVLCPDLRLLIVNGNPDDETSQLIRTLSSPWITEVSGNPNLFWSGLVNLGLRLAVSSGSPPEFVILMNADVEFDGDIFTPLIAKGKATPRSILAAVTVAGGKVVSSGVQVRSWRLTLNRHVLAGTLPRSLPKDELIQVDFLPGRCTLLPIEAVEIGGFVDEQRLPHYGGDYEYSNRLRRLGFSLFVYTGLQVILDPNNTGLSAAKGDSSFSSRLANTFSIKAAYNPWYRLVFVRLAYPWFAWPTAMSLVVLRSLVEIALGHKLMSKCVLRAESGYSGL